MAKPDKNDVLEEFIHAYTKANGKQPDIQAKSGWYSVDGGKNVRLAQVQDMTAALLEGGSKTPSTPKATKKAMSETPPKTTYKTRPKNVAKTKPQKSGFSVKQYWADKLNAEAPGSTQPR
jgi:hypothetical protein